MLLPHPKHPEIDSVDKVLNHVVKDILKMDILKPEDRVEWEEFMQEMQQGNAHLQKFCWFASFIAVGFRLLDLDSADPSSSMGIFFRVPSWFAPLLKFILEHDTGVQDCLLCYGYRSFSWLNLTAGVAHGPRSEGSVYTAVPTLDGDTRASGSFSVLCGYNIRECPECVGDGISFSGCGISEQQSEMA